LLADLPRRELSDDFDRTLRVRLDNVRAAGGRRTGIRAMWWWSRLSAAWDLRAPLPSPVQRLAPVGAMTAAALALAVWQLQPLETLQHPASHQPPDDVTALVQEHQLLGAGAELNSTVVSHNLGLELLGDGEDE
jgi:hypothetical protein